jgi:hypothetical protein
MFTCFSPFQHLSPASHPFNTFHLLLALSTPFSCFSPFQHLSPAPRPSNTFHLLLALSTPFSCFSPFQHLSPAPHPFSTFHLLLTLSTFSRFSSSPRPNTIHPLPIYSFPWAGEYLVQLTDGAYVLLGAVSPAFKVEDLVTSFTALTILLSALHGGEGEGCHGGVRHFFLISGYCDVLVFIPLVFVQLDAILNIKNHSIYQDVYVRVHAPMAWYSCLISLSFMVKY